MKHRLVILFASLGLASLLNAQVTPIFGTNDCPDCAATASSTIHAYPISDGSYMDEFWPQAILDGGEKVVSALCSRMITKEIPGSVTDPISGGPVSGQWVGQFKLTFLQGAANAVWVKQGKPASKVWVDLIRYKKYDSNHNLVDSFEGLGLTVTSPYGTAITADTMRTIPTAGLFGNAQAGYRTGGVYQWRIFVINDSDSTLTPKNMCISPPLILPERSGTNPWTLAQLYAIIPGLNADGTITWEPANSSAGGSTGTTGSTSGGGGPVQDSGFFEAIGKKLFQPQQENVDAVKGEISALANWGPFGVMEDLTNIAGMPADHIAPITISFPSYSWPNPAVGDHNGYWYWRDSSDTKVTLPERPLGDPNPTLRAFLGAGVYIGFIFFLINRLMPTQQV